MKKKRLFIENDMKEHSLSGIHWSTIAKTTTEHIVTPCVLLTPWTDDSRSEPARGVLPGSKAMWKVDLSTQEMNHTDLHVDPVNQFD